MLLVREIMTPSVVTLSPTQTLREAVETLVTCRIGGAPVIEGTRIVGVLSAPDVLEFESESHSPGEHHDESEDAVDPAFVAAPEWDAELDAIPSYFTDWWPNQGPDAAERIATEGAAQWDLLADHTVGEAMSRTICVLDGAMEVSHAAQRMLAADVQRALVVEERSLVGIVTTSDILRAVAERRLTVRHFVFEK